MHTYARPFLCFVSYAVMSIGAATMASPLPAPRAACRFSADYLVMSRARTSEVGTDIVVRRRSSSPKPCVFSVRPTDYVVAKDEAADVLAIRHRFLALDAGTGPDRRLLIFDVAARKKRFDIAYDDGAGFKANVKAFTYWRIDRQPSAPGACPATLRQRFVKDAKSVHVTYETIFTFDDAVPRETGKIGCVRTQNDM